MKTIAMKFGGTSVGSVEAISNLVAIVQRERAAGNRAILIVSAMSGVTDSLHRSVAAAIAGNRSAYVANAQALRQRHENALEQLAAPGAIRATALTRIEALIEAYVELCHAISVLGEATPRIWDAIVSFGERMSIHVVSAALRDHDIDAEPHEASEFIITNNNYQHASPLWEATQKRIEERLLPVIERGTVPVVTGYIGATPDGSITTLGRGGSDFSAAIFAAYTHSNELIIWTDVDGVLTTDPRIDPRAQVLPYVSYQEVGELAFYGAKVLHPKTVQPILDQGIPLRVRNTFNHEHPGTLIGSEERPTNSVIKAVSAVRDVSMLTVRGRGMIGLRGIAGRIFLAAARAEGNILLISQASSEQAICFIVIDADAQPVKAAIEAELTQELAAQDVDAVDVTDDVAIITVVGAAMAGTPGVAGRVFTTTGSNGINVIAIAQGASEYSISFVLSESELERAVTALHDLVLQPQPAA